MDRNSANSDVSAPTSPAQDDHEFADVSAKLEDVDATQSASLDPHAAAVESVTSSEIGIQTLLDRLKQSIASGKEFASFLKRRHLLEEEHANGFKKICRTTNDNLRKSEHRKGTWGSAYDEINRVHEQMAKNGHQFADTLHTMHDDMMDLVSRMERGRKQWKETGLTAEKRFIDAESAMRKAKIKYDSISEDYDRTRTGDRQGGKIFGIKGPKSAAQHEEDLLRKAGAADADYAQKVQNAQACKAELLSHARPEAISKLVELTRECDSATTLMMQKFATFNEKLLISNGTSALPLGGVDGQPSGRSLSEHISAIDNERDMNSYIASFSSRVPPKAPEIRYERNAALGPGPGTQSTISQRQPDPISTYNVRHGSSGPQSQSPASTGIAPTGPMTYDSIAPRASMDARYANPTQAPSEYGVKTAHDPPMQTLSQYNNDSSTRNMASQPVQNYNSPVSSTTLGASGAPQISSLSFQSPAAPSAPYSSPSTYSNYAPQKPTPVIGNPANLPPLNPVFGMTLDQLFQRDHTPVPMVVSQCIQAVDLFGLEVEGIYRLSGTNSHINRIKAMFDNDASRVDFRDPEAFFQDVNSVAGLLKQFFRDLPDPLLTSEHYQAFIDAAKHEDPTIRRDSLHAIINVLPDPNYATLRAICLHLNRVQESSSINRMNANNLAIVFGPTLMGANTGPNIRDAGWQVSVINTILTNTYAIFEDD